MRDRHVHSSTERPRFTLEETLGFARSRHSEGAAIVFTNGVFDFLHRGHLCYLRAARKLGGALVRIPLESGYSTAALIENIRSQPS